MSNQGLKNYFMAFCHWHLPCSGNASEEVCDVFLQKTIYAHFAIVFRRQKETNVKMHGQVAFRIGLKARSGMSKGKSKSKDGTASWKTGSIANKNRMVRATKTKKKKEGMPFSDDVVVNR